jgi:predicted nuclease of predicted toxin-antitoxin system
LRILADTNVVAQAVRAMRIAGHDVTYAAERPVDPGDELLLTEAVFEGRIFVTKDHDIGALVYRDAKPHCGVLLLDDMGDAAAEKDFVLEALFTHGERLLSGAFLRAGSAGIREAGV